MNTHEELVKIWYSLGFDYYKSIYSWGADREIRVILKCMRNTVYVAVFIRWCWSFSKETRIRISIKKTNISFHDRWNTSVDDADDIYI